MNCSTRCRPSRRNQSASASSSDPPEPTIWRNHTEQTFGRSPPLPHARRPVEAAAKEVSWQIIPDALGRYLGDPDCEEENRALQAMLKMKKIVVAELDRGYAS
jgi:hypothetical protein